MENITDTATLNWSYYPPQTFKVLLYFPETRDYLSSWTPSERYAFDSYYVARIGMDNSEPHLEVTRSYGMGWKIAGFLFRFLGTVAIEMLLAPLFGYWHKKQLGVILLVNLATQLLLNVLMEFMGFSRIFLFYAMTYGMLELLIFVIEAAVYLLVLHRFDPFDPEARPIGRPILYALTANLVSFCAGFMISSGFPYLF